MASKLCDSCRSATATLFCRADAAFLCVSCDSKIHAANKLASRHARVWVCEVCEQAPAHVTCKADAAALCVTCDRDIHSANPLALRHERVPVVPFLDPVNSLGVKPSGAVVNFLEDRHFSEVNQDAEVSSEEEEAAAWLLPNPKPVESPELNLGQYVLSEIDRYLDLDYGSVDPKVEAPDQNNSGTDCVVPVQSQSPPAPSSAKEHLLDMDFTASQPFPYVCNAQCLRQSLSSSSMEVGLVPEGNTMSDMSTCCRKPMSTALDSASQTVPFSAADREARVLRYREKRKNRKFEKTIRYASRKAYAETRPRIKGRFAKRSDVEVEADSLAEYGVVPSY